MMNKSGIYPSGNRVLVKPDAVEEVTKGGIVVPQSVKDKHQMSVNYGQVVSLGPDCFTHTTTTVERLIDDVWKPVERNSTGYSGSFADEGDRVAFAMYSGLNITGEDGEDYKLINDEDITCRVTNNVVQTTIESRKAIADGY